MQDRISTYPGRVTLTPVPGQEHTYDMARADQPTQPGTPLSKATFLKDATAALYGLNADAVPDEVLSILSSVALHKSSPSNGLYDLSGALITGLPVIQTVTGSYIGTGTYGSGNPNRIATALHPVLAFIRPMLGNSIYHHTILAKGMDYAASWTSGSPGGGWLQAEFEDDAVSWFAVNGSWSSNSSGTGDPNAEKQLNVSGRTYNYVILGYKGG